jgi:hypothetical protein
VQFTRSYTVFDHQDLDVTDEMLEDWVVELPRISGTFAPDWIDSQYGF